MESTPYIVEITRWSCAYADHCHKSKETAENCIRIHNKKPPLSNKWSDNAKIFFSDRNESGVNMSKLARRLDMHPSRIFMLAQQGKRIKLRKEYNANNMCD